MFGVELWRLMKEKLFEVIKIKILLLRITLKASWVHSLKEKRMVLLSITQRLKNKFNLSISEVLDQDIHQSIVLGIAIVGTSSSILHATKEAILDFIEDSTDAELINIEEEIINY